MKVYKEDLETIFLSQYKDPLMDHLYTKILFHLREIKGKKILDLGCGLGKVALSAAKEGYLVTGIELEGKAIKIARANCQKERLEDKCRFIKGDFLKIKIKDNSYDIVVCSEVVEHLKDPRFLADRVYRWLKGGGYLVLTTPHGNKYWTVLDDYAEHLRRFEISQIKKILSRFEIIKLYTVGFPGMVILVMIYNLYVKIFKINHNASWRKKGIGNLYYLISSLFLKIDGLFNHFNLGLDLVVLARKPKAKKLTESL